LGTSAATILIFLLLAPVVLYLIFRNPKNSLFMLVATFPMFNVESIALGAGFLVVSPNKVFGAVVVVLMVVDVLSKGKEFKFLSPHMVLSLLLFGAMLISFLVNGSHSLTWAQRYLSNIFFLLAMVTWINTREEADRVWQVFIYSLAVVTILSMFGLDSPEESSARSAAERFDATMLNANRAARTYLIGIGLATGWLMRTAGVTWRRWLGFGLMVLFTWSILLTGSRAGFIALVVTMAGIPFLLASRRRTRGLVVPFILAALLIAVFTPEVVSRRVTQIPTMEHGLAKEEARRSRIHQYRLAVELINKEPILGIGPHEFNRVYSQRVEGDIQRSLHSWYLKVAVDAGLPGLFLFLALLVLSLAIGLRGAIRGRSIELRGQAWGFTFMVAGLMVFGTVSSVPYSKLMWLVFAVAAVELQLQQKERKTDQDAAVQTFRDCTDELSAGAGTVVVIKKD